MKKIFFFIPTIAILLVIILEIIFNISIPLKLIIYFVLVAIGLLLYFISEKKEKNKRSE
ncbi:MAG: hypothetical protein PQJ46_14625 [Spirochaetales bacterium]|nr:hypothetical protein [Spirochaetales bacterium]